jgi:hypothetical protein
MKSWPEVFKTTKEDQIMAFGKEDDPLEKQLLEALKFGGLDKANLAELVRAVVDLNAKGIAPGKVFPRGLPCLTV